MRSRLLTALVAVLLAGCDPYGGRGLVSVGGPTPTGGTGGGPDRADRPDPPFDRGGTGGTGGNGAEGGDTGLPGTAGSLLFGDEPDGSFTVYRVNSDGTLTELGNYR